MPSPLDHRARYLAGVHRYSAEQTLADQTALIAEIGADVGCCILDAAETVDGTLRVSPDAIEAIREEYRERVPDDARWASVLGSALLQIRRTQQIHVLPSEA